MDPQQLTHQISVLRAITSRYSRHDFVGNPNVLTWLLGRPPTTFEAYVRNQQDEFVRRGPSSSVGTISAAQRAPNLTPDARPGMPLT
jgi:hypothetical protein